MFPPCIFMAHLIAKWLIVALSFLLAAYIVPGIEIVSFTTALVLSFFWGIINLFVRPILLILTLPINLITFGFFTFVINALLLWALGSVIRGVFVEGFLPAFFGALIIAVAGWLGNKFISSLSDSGQYHGESRERPRIHEQ